VVALLAPVLVAEVPLPPLLLLLLLPDAPVVVAAELPVAELPLEPEPEPEPEPAVTDAVGTVLPPVADVGATFSLADAAAAL